MKTSPLIFYENQWTGFHVIGTSVMKELRPCQTFVMLFLTRIVHG